MAWATPIYDRTADDIANMTAKAHCNVVDLQRLEDNSAVLADPLGITITTKTWTITDFPTAAELARILANIDALRTTYYTRSTTPDTPENPLNSWQKWNAAEQILNDLYVLYLANISAYIRAGEAYSGEQIGVI
jgi:hypothetical protein